MKLLAGKTALVTGATRGIGKGIALKLANAGANIAFTFVSSVEKAKLFEAELATLGVKAKGYQSNAAEFAEAEKLIEDIVKEFGGVDVVVNNAGITRDNLMMRMTEQMWDEVMNTNLKSAFAITKAVQRPMMKERSGSIINITSVVGITGNAGQANYAASKAGMIGLTKSVAKELGSRNIRCNAIAPGFIETEMTEALPEETRKEWCEGIALKRGGSPEDVANAVLFLACDMSTYVTGQTINVCGGMVM
ncbi:3-ketoacyl-ACP reductase [Bacteroidetes bacterium UKL13-3]|jgi:3-oxoacyl-[acyl-carrier protein] reductase|nr:3-ketoacyl-ACP reductase [Bacteroidetes bacterium UKL13-3]HCP93093.1 3-oxoacyl-[acyl-carrier-protein] reductase [Bacteroidota bacterium]